MAKRSASRQMNTAERRKMVASLIAAGHTMQAISNHLGVGKSTVYRDKDAILADWRQQHVEDISQVFVTDLRRLEIIQGGLWKKALSGDIKSIEAYLKLMMRRAKMLGYDQAAEVNLNLSGNLSGQSPTQLGNIDVSGLFETLAGIPESEIDALIENLQIAATSASNPEAGYAIDPPEGEGQVIEGEYFVGDIDPPS